MARREPKILTDVPRMARRDPRNVPLKADLRDRRGGQGDDTKWLPKAARTALESAALDGLLRSSASLAARGLGRIAPVFVGPGRGMRPASVGVADGVYVPRAAAERVGDTADLKRFDAMLAGRDFASLPRAERVAIVKETGWQQLPTGETVRQLPKFEFAKGAWRGAERFATPARRRLSKLAGESVSELPDLELGEALAGPGAERFFGYYPEARRWLFRTDDLPAGTLGFVGTGSRMTTLSGEALVDGPATVANALHHEVQHVVQDASRLPLGSSSADAYGELNRAMFRAMVAGRSSDPAVRTGARALVTADGMRDPARYAYMHTGGEAGAYAVGNTATEGPAALLTDAMTREGITPGNVYDLAAIRAVSQDAKGGSSESALDPRGRVSTSSSPRPGGEAPSDRFSMTRNFLATDKVPETIFGIPVVSKKEDYTEADIEFFRQHPEAGGYYDLGEETPEAAGREDMPTQAAKGGKARGRYPGAWNNPGNVQKGEVEYDGESGSVKGRISEGTFLKFRTPQDGLNAMAQSIGQMVREKIPRGFREGSLPDDRFTIDNLVKVYAPKKDVNDTAAYARFVSGWTGLARDRALDLKDAGQMTLLLDAMVRQDSGHPHADWFSAADRAAAVGKMGTAARKRSEAKTEVGDAKKK